MTEKPDSWLWIQLGTCGGLMLGCLGFCAYYTWVYG